MTALIPDPTGATLSPDTLLVDEQPTPTGQSRYHEVTVDAPDDPLLVATRVVEAGLSDTHVLYERPGTWTVALGALASVVVTPTEVVLAQAGCAPRSVPWQGSPVDRVAELLEQLTIDGWRAYGWASFELAYAHAGMHELLPDEKLLHLVVPHTEVRLADGRAHVRTTRPALVGRLRDLLATPVAPHDHQPTPVAVEHANADAYRTSVAAAVRDIQDGTLQKVILSRVVEVAHPVDLVGTYVVGRRRNTPSRSYLLDVGGMRAAGFSPEIVLAVDETGLVTTQPLAGTRALSDDRGLRDELLGDSKEIFEHAISVKVSWDELTELCEPGSVVVDDYMAVKERGSVQHLASSVSGRLSPGRTAWQAFATLFPAVTASGVPKNAAYPVIHRHESEPRGLYSGAVLAVDQSGTFDAALVLRTIFQRGERTWLRAGAGIVEQSRPDRELEETCEKLRSVALHVVGRNT